MTNKILFVVPYAPNLIRVRPYNLIRQLSQRGNQVTVLTLWTEEHERDSLEQLKAHADQVLAVRLPRWRSLWNCFAALPTSQPLQTVYCWEPALTRLINPLIENGNGRHAFDVIHVEHLRGARYGLYLKSLFAGRKPALPIVWDSVDSISLLFRQAMLRSKSLFSRSLTRFELGRTQAYEAWLVRQFDRVAVTSPADRQALLGLLPEGEQPPPISVLPNGVDLDYFKPGESILRELDTLVISGKMSYHANVTMVLHFVQEIMPLVWDRRPGARVLVVGKDPSREIQALSADSRITVTGTVEHLPPYLQKASLAVAPIAYGAGIQNKVLEAMACQTPVVASPQAVSALNVRPGQDLIVAQEPAAFAGEILNLLDDPNLQQRVGQAGRAYVEAHHHWYAVAGRFEELYEQAVTARY